MALSPKEKQKAYRIRQAKKNQVKAKVVEVKRKRRTPEQLETEHWTKIERCFAGTATEAEYCSLDKNYFQVRKGGERWVVGPSIGPVRMAV